jgi:hypothetical protein
MQTTLQTLSAHVAEFVRRTFAAYLPCSPLSGIGQASELAARHPAFAPAQEATYRSA